MKSPTHILVIEDTETDQYVACRRLHKRWPEAEIVAATDGIEAIAWLDGGGPVPDLILLDINMPRMNGHDFLAARFGERATSVPVVVMLTSSVQEDDRQRTSRYPNVRGYVIKPLDPDDVDMLERLIDDAADPRAA